MLFLLLLSSPHCPTNIPASAFYWIYAVFYWAAKGTKWEAGLAGLTGTRVRLANMGRVAWSGTSAVVGHKGTWQQWQGFIIWNSSRNLKEPTGIGSRELSLPVSLSFCISEVLNLTKPVYQQR